MFILINYFYFQISFYLFGIGLLTDYPSWSEAITFSQ